MNLLRIAAGCALLQAFGGLAAPASPALDFIENGDAGPVLTSAQVVPNDQGSVDTISGNISNLTTDTPINDLSGFGAAAADVDLFEISIHDPTGFSATTQGGDSTDPSTEFDAQLALFDASGFGVYANDDGTAGNGNAKLPAGNALGPMQAGTYYLAIYDDDVSPISALTLSGPIFPSSSPPDFTQILGPTGPGGAAALLDWFPGAAIVSSRSYTILLTGVPEPTTAASSAVALFALFVLRRKGGVRAFGRPSAS